jgi:8-oxo-dGTP pyrophosphatase MutT (NUDIX family)
MSEPIRSAVAVLEMPQAYVLQRRPDLPGKLVSPGKLQFLGGHADDGEALIATVRREIGEETDLDPAVLEIEPVWEGPYKGQDKQGNPVMRHVGLFRVCIDKMCGLREQGALVEIPKSPAAIEAHKQELAPFAYDALRRIIGVEAWR